MMKKFIRHFVIFLYYFFVIIFFCMDYIDISSYLNMESTFFDFLFVVLVLFPLFFKFVLKKAFRISMISCFSILFILFCISEVIANPYRNFSSERWDDERFCSIRFVMVDRLKEQYHLKGKNREDIYQLLGKPGESSCYAQEYISKNYDYHELCYRINDSYLYFCFLFDKEGYVEQHFWKDTLNSYTYD